MYDFCTPDLEYIIIDFLVPHGSVLLSALTIKIVWFGSPSSEYVKNLMKSWYIPSKFKFLLVL